MVTMRSLVGVVDDGLGGAASDAYGGADRNCSWRIVPDGPLTSAGQALVLTITSVELRKGYDKLTVLDGVAGVSHVAAVSDADGGSSTRLLSLPPSADTDTDMSSSCANATGACLQTLVALSGAATVALHSLARGDGTASRISLRYFTVAPPEVPSLSGSLRAAVVDAYGSGESAHAALAVQRAAEWTSAEAEVGTALRLRPLSRAATLIGGDVPVGGGMAVRTDPSRYASSEQRN